MTSLPVLPDLAASTELAGLPGLLLASRGDPLTPFLADALRRRHPIAGSVDPELTSVQRLTVAARTFHPSRRVWVERFYKSRWGFQLRTRNAARQISDLGRPFDLALQVHALFDIAGPATMLYIDCTHRQSAELWPAWNPLSGAALSRWYAQEQEQYQRAHHLFAFSHFTARSLINDYGVDPDKVTVTGAGANLSAWPDRPARAEQPTILFVGNDFARKGGHVLLDAFARVRRSLPQARLQLVGTEPGITAPPGVEVLGRLRDRRAVEALYRNASLLALPSYYDPFPLVLLEAMAFSLPTVTTDVCGIPEMVVEGETGRMVKPGDPEALADALLAVLTDPATARRLGAGGRRRVRQLFSWDAVVARMQPALTAGVNR